MLLEYKVIQSFLYPASPYSHCPKSDLQRQAKPGDRCCLRRKQEGRIASLMMLINGILKACNSFLFDRVFQKSETKEGHSRRVTLSFSSFFLNKKPIHDLPGVKTSIPSKSLYNGILPVLLPHQDFYLEKAEATSGEKQQFTSR